jgi:5-methylcytosine-specific restriction endonuclease McrA
MAKRSCLGPAPGQPCPWRRLTSESRCPDCKRAHQRARDFARSGDPIRRFRRSQAWIKTSREFRAARPAVCTLCGATEDLTTGHIIPLAELLRAGRMDLALDWGNLRVECRPCQNKQGHQQPR